MKNNKIKGLLYKVDGNEPQTVEIENTLESLQKIVGGYIETVYMRVAATGLNAILVLNEDGKVKGLPYSCYVPKIRDFIAGDCIILGDGGEDFTDAPQEILDKTVWLAMPVSEVETT